MSYENAKLLVGEFLAGAGASLENDQFKFVTLARGSTTSVTGSVGENYDFSVDRTMTVFVDNADTAVTVTLGPSSTPALTGNSTAADVASAITNAAVGLTGAVVDIDPGPGVRNAVQVTAATNIYFPAEGEFALKTLGMINPKDNQDGTVVLSSASGQDVLGVLQDTPADGEVCTIANGGVSKVVVGAAINRGLYVMPDSEGRAVIATSGNEYFGQTLDASGAVDDLVSIDMSKKGTVP